MKKPILFAAALGFIMVTQTGCFSSTDNGGTAAQLNSGTESTTESSSSESNHGNQPGETDKSRPTVNSPSRDESASLDAITDWVDLFEDSEDPAKAAVYDEAFALIQKTTRISGQLLKPSKHFGNWYQIQIKAAEDAPGEFDGPRRYNTAFLVDMSNRTIIAKGDLKSASALLHRLIQLGHSTSEDGTGDFIQTMSSIVSSIEFNHAGYVENSELDGFHVPLLTKDEAGNSHLEYFVSDGVSETLNRCSLTVQNGNFVFEQKN